MRGLLGRACTPRTIDWWQSVPLGVFFHSVTAVLLNSAHRHVWHPCCFICTVNGIIIVCFWAISGFSILAMYINNYARMESGDNLFDTFCYYGCLVSCYADDQAII